MGTFRYAGVMAQGDVVDGWTRALVEARLIADFRAVPFFPIYREGDPVGTPEALGWAIRHIPNRAERLAVLIWARSMARGVSVREQYRALGWSRSSAEEKRRRGLERILGALREIDSRTKQPVA